MISGDAPDFSPEHHVDRIGTLRLIIISAVSVTTAAWLYRLAAERCPHNFTESYAANAELKQLGQ